MLSCHLRHVPSDGGFCPVAIPTGIASDRNAQKEGCTKLFSTQFGAKQHASRAHNDLRFPCSDAECFIKPTFHPPGRSASCRKSLTDNDKTKKASFESARRSFLRAALTPLNAGRNQQSKLPPLPLPWRRFSARFQDAIHPVSAQSPASNLTCSLCRPPY